MIYWFTGQPGSGKSTLARALKSALREQGYSKVIVDGWFLRELMGNTDYSEAGRIRNVRAGQLLATKLQADGIVVVASFVSPYRNLREEFKRTGEVVEIYVHTTEVRGREPHFAAGFEPPQQNFVDIDTTNISVTEWIRKILEARPVSAAHRNDD